ncbi:hypothetical protein [Mycobacterium sp.]|uniref:hypothetical protein n=1 Tax=Mycobacterium sp. TaxID=1785 RepID=UPI003F9C12BE
MARERGGPDVCPLHGGLRHDAAIDGPLTDQASAAEQVDWAGLPVNLDMVFSKQQRDKVYVQYLMRKRGTPLWRWLQNGAQPCACDAADDGGRRSPDAAESMSSR